MFRFRPTASEIPEALVTLLPLGKRRGDDTVSESRGRGQGSAVFTRFQEGFQSMENLVVRRFDLWCQ